MGSWWARLGGRPASAEPDGSGTGPRDVVIRDDVLPTSTVTALPRRSTDRTEPGPGPAVRLRAGRRGDAVQWSRLRLEGHDHLQRWEPQLAEPWEVAYAPSRWRRAERANLAATRAGLAVPAVVEVDGRFAGEVTIGGIVRGANQTAWIGYWLGAEFCGRGVGTCAVALAVDIAFEVLRLARLEATVRPDNGPSRGVLEANGFSEEGRLRDYLQVDGRRRDHALYALLARDFDASAVDRLVAAGRATRGIGG